MPTKGFAYLSTHLTIDDINVTINEAVFIQLKNWGATSQSHFIPELLFNHLNISFLTQGYWDQVDISSA